MNHVVEPPLDRSTGDLTSLFFSTKPWNEVKRHRGTWRLGVSICLFRGARSAYGLFEYFSEQSVRTSKRDSGTRQDWTVDVANQELLEVLYGYGKCMRHSGALAVHILPLSNTNHPYLCSFPFLLVVTVACSRNGMTAAPALSSS